MSLPATDLYLLLALLIDAGALGVAVLRRDLVRPMLAVALFGALWGPLSELWFFQDYWRPRGVFGEPWVEDALFGGGLSALAAGVFPLVSRRRLGAGSFRQARLLVVPAFIGLYALAMVVIQSGLHVNSILVAMLVNLLLTAFMVARRPDLLVPAAVSSGLLAVLTAAGYAVGLDLLVDGRLFLSQIWLLYGSSLGVTILGSVPLTEVLWYATWSAMLAIAYEYVTGARLVRSAFPLFTSSRTPSGSSASARPGPGAR